MFGCISICINVFTHWARKKKNGAERIICEFIKCMVIVWWCCAVWKFYIVGSHSLLSLSPSRSMCASRYVRRSLIPFYRAFSCSDYHSQFIFWLLLLDFITIYIQNQLEARRWKHIPRFSWFFFCWCSCFFLFPFSERLSLSACLFRATLAPVCVDRMVYLTFCRLPLVVFLCFCYLRVIKQR